MDKALLGWGDLVVKGPNEMFTGTLGETPQPNGIGGGTARPAIRTNKLNPKGQTGSFWMAAPEDLPRLSQGLDFLRGMVWS